jgi:hypothetical protein
MGATKCDKEPGSMQEIWRSSTRQFVGTVRHRVSDASGGVVNSGDFSVGVGSEVLRRMIIGPDADSKIDLSGTDELTPIVLPCLHCIRSAYT